MKNKKRIIIWSIIIIVLVAITWAVYYFTITPKQTKYKCNEVQCDDDHYVSCRYDIGGWNCYCRCKPYIWF